MVCSGKLAFKLFLQGMFAQLIYKLTFGTYPIHNMVASFKEHILKYTQHIIFLLL